MKSLITIALAFFILFSINQMAAAQQPLDGYYNSSNRFGSGWIDLKKNTTFESGNCLQLKLGGSASKILIRLLQAGDDPNQASGIINGVHNVPESHVIVFKLTRTFPNIKQISVHGNPNPFDYDLGAKNGPAKLEDASIVPCPAE